MLSRNKRVLSSAEFRVIYGSGVRMTSRYFAAFCLRLEPLPREQGRGNSRFGFTVPRAVGKAVKRNRIKRRLREAVRSQLQVLQGEWAVVFNPRRSVLSAPFDDLCREVGRIFARCSES